MSEPSNRSFRRRLDVGGQIACIILPLVYWLAVRDQGLGGASFLLIYIFLGLWQAVSCIAWLLLTPWRAVSAGRKFYLLMFGLLAVALLPLINHSSSFLDRGVWILLGGSGVLGIYYLVLSCLEGRVGRPVSSPAFRGLKIFDALGQIVSCLLVLSLFLPDAPYLSHVQRVDPAISTNLVSTWYLVSISAWGVSTRRAAKPYMRLVMEKVFLILVGLSVVGSLLPMAMLPFSYALSYAAPVAAVAYTALTIAEAVRRRSAVFAGNTIQEPIDTLSPEQNS